MQGDELTRTNRSTCTTVELLKGLLEYEWSCVEGVQSTRNRLAQLVKRRTTVRKVAGSNPAGPKNQGYKITGKIMPAVGSTSASV